MIPVAAMRGLRSAAGKDCAGKSGRSRRMAGREGKRHFSEVFILNRGGESIMKGRIAVYPVFLMLIAGLMWGVPAAAKAKDVVPDRSPLEVIRSGTDRALEVLRSCPPDASREQIRERREMILEIVYDYFNFEEMARRSLGRHGKYQSSEDLEKFTDLLEQLLFNTYINRVDSYTCRDEEVVYVGEEIEGKYAQVKTRVVGVKDADIPVVYRMRIRDGKWWVYDIVVEGISLVNNYRSQFNSVLAENSFDELIKQLEEKVKAQNGEEG